MYVDTIGICYGVPDEKYATNFDILVESGFNFKDLVASSSGLTVEDVLSYEDATDKKVLGRYNLMRGVEVWVMDTESNRKSLVIQPTFLVKATHESEYVRTKVNPRLHMISTSDWHRIKLTYEEVGVTDYERMTTQQLRDGGWRVTRIEGCDSKYGRIAFNDECKITRGLTANEFYGSVY